MRQILVILASVVVAGCGGGRADELMGPQSLLEPRPGQAQSLPLSATSRTYNGTDFIDTDPGDVPAQVYRLYNAAFSRTSDASGLGYHVGHIEKLGQSLNEIAANFVGSPEFNTRYGSLSNAQYVTQLYANVLARSPDAQGLQYHQDNLQSGRLTRGQVLVGFSESPENKDKTSAAVAAGIHFTSWLPPTAAGTLPVRRSSYENKAGAGAALGSQKLPSGTNNGYVFADFFQDGTYSLVSHTLIYSKTRNPSLLGSIQFFRNEGGQWVDRTQMKLADTTGCLHARKALVADFNGDNKPDVFFSCSGFDFEGGAIGEQQRVLLSQPDGTYRNIVIPVTCYCHSATAVDSRGDGYADIVVTDTMVRYTPFFLINQRNGTFSVDTTRLPGGDPSKNPESLITKSIFSLEFLDFTNTGRYDLWVAGEEPGSNGTSQYQYQTRILQNDGGFRFIGTESKKLPLNTTYGLPLDVAFLNGKIYHNRTNTSRPSGYYTAAALEELDYATLQSRLIYEHSGMYRQQQNLFFWINWIIPYQGKIVPMDVDYGALM